MAITKSTVINTGRAEVRLNRHVGVGEETITFNVSASNHGFSSTLHMTISDAKKVFNALAEVLEDEVAA